MPTVLAPGPALPLAKSGKMPALTQLVTAVWNSLSEQLSLPQLLLEMRGRRAGLAALPSTRVGASVHWKPFRIGVVSQALVAQMRTLIHCAPGAVPILPYVALGELPTMVP